MKPLFFILGLFALTSFMANASDRFVVAGGSLTEIIYALGAEAHLVGVDSSSHYPQAARSLPDVGYFRTLNVEGVLSVSPTKVLLLQGSGPQSVIDQMAILGIEIHTFNNPKTFGGLVQLIREVAKVTGKASQGEILIAQIQQQMDIINAQSDLPGKTAVFLMSAGERGLVAAGSNTTPQLIFDSLGVANPFSSLDGFKPISAEALAQTPADIILIASHTTRGLSVASLCQSNQLKLWADQKGCNLIKIDSLKYLGLTPRLPDAITETRKYLAE